MKIRRKQTYVVYIFDLFGKEISYCRREKKETSSQNNITEEKKKEEDKAIYLVDSTAGVKRCLYHVWWGVRGNISLIFPIQKNMFCVICFVLTSDFSVRQKSWFIKYDMRIRDFNVTVCQTCLEHHLLIDQLVICD